MQRLSSLGYKQAMRYFGVSFAESPLDVFETSGDASIVDDDVNGSDMPFETIEVSDLSKVKEWLGNSNADIDAGLIQNRMLSREFEADTANDGDIAGLAEAARQFVFGHSAEVEKYQDAIEEAFTPFRIAIGGAKRIVVKAGSPLVLKGSDPKILAADELIFEGKGAQIQSYIHLSMKVKKVTIVE